MAFIALRRFRLASLVGVVLAVMLAGCMSVPIAETNAFVAAVDAVKSATDVLLGQVNAAEKDLSLRQARAAPGGAFRPFVVKDARYYSTLDTLGEGTEKFAAAMRIIKEYADLIQSLVQGQGNAAAHEHIKSIAGDLSALAGAPEFAAAVAALSPLIDKALLAQSRAQARNLVSSGAPALETLIDNLIAASPQIFSLLKAAAQARGEFAEATFDNQRVAVSDFVVLLSRLKDAIVSLADAFSRPSNAASLAALAQATGELNADAKIIAQALAAAKLK